jgi:hypothetical protein
MDFIFLIFCYIIAFVIMKDKMLMFQCLASFTIGESYTYFNDIQRTLCDSKREIKTIKNKVEHLEMEIETIKRNYDD